MIGISCGFHDAALAVVEGDQIVYAGHAERYSRKKNDPWLNHDLVRQGNRFNKSDGVIYYEKPFKKWTRQALYHNPRPEYSINGHIREWFGPYGTVGHHESHAAAGYFTSGFDDAAVVVVDAIGEWDTVSIWHGKGTKLNKIKSIRYPHSMGLLYSAFTQRVGLTPNEEEYIMMGMSAYGQPLHVREIEKDFLDERTWDFRLRKNVHQGVGNWMPTADNEDIASSIQFLLERYLIRLFRHARSVTGSKNVVYQGGVALNCVANTKIIADGAFDNYWIMPNPGDAGAALGAILAEQQRHIEWKTPFLGYNIDRRIEPAEVVTALLDDGVCGIANGRAEFGPRALGNRSLLADPRVPTMQNRVNEIKKREKFRPFAPIVLAEHVDEWFHTYGADCRYMQYAVHCRSSKQAEIPAVVHVDGSSRVQTIYPEDGNIHAILTAWHTETGCPVLLNTSLNIKGEPLVNTVEDAEAFASLHKVRVF